MTQNCSWQIGAESLSHWGYHMWMGHYSFNFALWCLLIYIRLFHMVPFSRVSRAAAWASVHTHRLRPCLMKIDDSPSLVIGHRWTKMVFCFKPYLPLRKSPKTVRFLFLYHCNIPPNTLQSSDRWGTQKVKTFSLTGSRNLQADILF